jgi:hypothetical protein
MRVEFLRCDIRRSHRSNSGATSTRLPTTCPLSSSALAHPASSSPKFAPSLPAIARNGRQSGTDFEEPDRTSMQSVNWYETDSAPSFAHFRNSPPRTRSSWLSWLQAFRDFEMLLAK